VNHVSHLVALADPDPVTEVVGDDAEVIAMIVDVGRQPATVPPTEDDLLAQIRGAPIDFDVELVGLDQAWRPLQRVAHLGKE
jgi:hypothetical protein